MFIKQIEIDNIRALLHSSELNGLPIDPIKYIWARFEMTVLLDDKTEHQLRGTISFYKRSDSYEIEAYHEFDEWRYYNSDSRRYCGWLTKEDLLIDESVMPYKTEYARESVRIVQYYAKTIADEFQKELKTLQKESHGIGVPLLDFGEISPYVKILKRHKTTFRGGKRNMEKV